MYMLNKKDFDELRGKNQTSRTEWKLSHNTRKRCFECCDRNKTLFQCSRCQSGVCIPHSTLLCDHCLTFE